MAAPITLSGFNNIDFKSIVDLIIQSERQPIDRLQAQQKTEQSRLTAYQDLTSVLNRLQDAFSAVQSTSAFGDLQATSSDTSVLTASASTSAAKGTFQIDVTSLARPQVTASAARQFDDINATIIDGGSLSLTQGGTTTAIDLTGVTTLTELRDAINAQQTGVRASIINDGSTEDDPPKPFRLVLTSKSSGVDSAFTVDDQTTYGGGVPGSVLNLSTDPATGVALDTQLEYNGISIRSSSTTVIGAVPGLTLTLLKTGSTSVTVTDDPTSLKEKFTEIVDAFNALNDFVQKQFEPATSGSSRPPLAADSLLRNLNRQIRSYLTSNHSNSGDIQNLTSLGIELDRSGKLTLDTSTLDKALSDDLAGVQAFLTEASGLAATVTASVTAFTDSVDSVEAGIKTTISSYDNRIATLEAQLALREDTLTRQFAAADEAISQLNSQANALTSLSSTYRLF